MTVLLAIAVVAVPCLAVAVVLTAGQPTPRAGRAAGGCVVRGCQGHRARRPGGTR